MIETSQEVPAPPVPPDALRHEKKERLVEVPYDRLRAPLVQAAPYRRERAEEHVGLEVQLLELACEPVHLQVCLLQGDEAIEEKDAALRAGDLVSHGAHLAGSAARDFLVVRAVNGHTELLWSLRAHRTQGSRKKGL